MSRLAVVVLSVMLAVPALAKDANPKEARRQAARRAQAQVARARQIQRLVDLLIQVDPRQRYYAAWNLRVLLPASQPALLKILTERTPKQLWAAVEAANVAGEARLLAAAKPMRACVRDGTAPLIVRVSAVLGLAKLMTPDSQAFLARLAEDNEAPELLREAAAVCLGVQGLPGTAKAAKGLLRLGPSARRAGLRALGLTQDRRHAARCLEGLDDPSPAVRSMAAIALGQLNDLQTRVRLVKVLPRVRQAALATLLLHALARMNHPPAVTALLRQARDRKHPGQLQAVATLTAIRAPGAAAIFRALLPQALRGKHQPGVAEALCLALPNLGDTLAVPVLTRALTHGTLPCRRAAARGLGRLGTLKGVDPARVVEPMRTALAKNNDRILKVELLLSLGRVGQFAVRRELQQALADREPILRWAAIMALEGLKDPAQARLLEPLTRDAQPLIQAAAKRALALLRNQPAPGWDTRDQEVLAHLRRLEQELLCRAQHETRRLELSVAMRTQQVFEPKFDWSTVTHARIGSDGLPFGTEGGGGLPFIWKRAGKRFEDKAALAVSTALRESTEETYHLRLMEGRARSRSALRHDDARPGGPAPGAAKLAGPAPTRTPRRKALEDFRDALTVRTHTIQAGELKVTLTFVPNYDLHRAVEHVLAHLDEPEAALRRHLARLRPKAKRDRGLPGLLIRFQHAKAAPNNYYASEGKPSTWIRAAGVRLTAIRTVGTPTRAARPMLFQASKSKVYADTNISPTARRRWHVLPEAEETFGLDLRVRKLPRSAKTLEVTLRNLIHVSGPGVTPRQVDFKQGAQAAFERFPPISLALPVPAPPVPKALARLLPR